MESDEKVRRIQMLLIKAKSGELQENENNLLESKMAELIKTRDELKRSKENATQSWLDSRPLIDKLERLKSSLASAENQSTMSTLAVSELQSQLETTTASIKKKKEELLKAQSRIKEIRQALDRTREELQTNKQNTDERQSRSELKQTLQLKKKTLRTLQLQLRAASVELEALKLSAANALHHIDNSKQNNSTIQLTHEEYYALIRKAEEQTSLSDWRVSMSMEHKSAAEARQDIALRKLEKLYSIKRLREKETTEDDLRGDEQNQMEVEKQNSSIRVAEAAIGNRRNSLTEARAGLLEQSNRRNTPRQVRRSRSNNRRMVKKKTSILHQIKRFFVRSIRKFLK